MSFTLAIAAICGGMFVAMIVGVELGRRWGLRKRGTGPELPGSSAVEASVFALLGLLVVAAGLEAVLGFCLGCTVFAALMRAGVIPEQVCAECADISLRLRQAA